MTETGQPTIETKMTIERERHKNFEERSEVAQEIISRKPDFFAKWALVLFLILFLLLMAGSWFIKYPEVITASAVLTSDNAPKELVARQSGKLIALFSQNNQPVKQDQIIGWIESNADTKEVIDLANRLDSSVSLLISGNPQSITALFNKHFTNLGEIQTSYQSFHTACQQYNDYIVNGYYAKRESMLLNDIASLQEAKEHLFARKKLTVDDNKLSKTTFEMNKKLFEEKIISAEEYRRAQSELLNKQQIIPQMEASLIAQQDQIRSKQKEIDQLNHDILQQQQLFEQALQTLRSQVDGWLKRYMIQAPSNGTIVFTTPLQQNQYVEQGKVLGYVNLPDSRYYAEIRLSQYNFGKVDSGMKVQLRFDAYPYQEVGFVKGTLSYISGIAVDSAFWGTARLDEGLMTSHHQVIPYRNGLKAQALIITKDMRLLQRLYYSIVKSVSVN